MSNFGKRMVKEPLIAQIGQGGGSEYTAGNGINIAEDVISVADNVVTKDASNKIVINKIESVMGEEDSNLAEIRLYSGGDSSELQLRSDGEEAGGTILLRGTTAVGSEGIVTISGETTFQTDLDIKVRHSDNTTDVIAYKSDIPSTPTNMVTTDTNQTISGQKTITSSLKFASSDSGYGTTLSQSNGDLSISSNFGKFITIAPYALDLFTIQTGTSGTYKFKLPTNTVISAGTHTFAVEDRIAGYGTLPDTSVAGTYVLKATVDAQGNVTYSWVIENV